MDIAQSTPISCLLSPVFCLLPAVSLLLSSCRRTETPDPRPPAGRQGVISLTSTAFTPGGRIPRRYTCQGNNVSPPLRWSGVPAGSRSLAMLCEDPDAPGGTWTHWVLYDVAPESHALPESIPPREALSSGARQGLNSFQKIGYGGPCPPGGTHHYIWKLYALDNRLKVPAPGTREQLINAMNGHIVGDGQLMGTYTKQ